MEKLMNLKRALIATAAAMLIPGMALAQDEFTARFDVSKSFDDGNTASVGVTIECNTGSPLTQSATISDAPGGGVEFVVNNMVAAEGVWCEIMENSGTTGYDAMYMADDAVANATSCLYYAVAPNGPADGHISIISAEGNSCEISNEAGLVAVTVGKSWDFAGAGGESVDTDVTVNIMSDGPLFADAGGTAAAPSCPEPNDDYYCWSVSFSGDSPADQMFYVQPAFGGTKVMFDESVLDSSVETSNTCGGSVMVHPGDSGASCDFENAVFFEGIPTLSQYGMAIMALLMLGVGFVAFRRFV
jgi:hypothetical protein